MFRIADCHGETRRREPAASPFPVRTHPDVRRYPALLGQPDHVHLRVSQCPARPAFQRRNEFTRSRLE
jgi:hypothetical protein